MIVVGGGGGGGLCAGVVMWVCVGGVWLVQLGGWCVCCVMVLVLYAKAGIWRVALWLVL